MDFLVHFLAAGLIFVVIDSLWIGIVANKFYKKQMGSLLLDKPKFVPAVIFYVISVAAMVVLVIDPALQADSVAKGFALGAVFGLASYATYDLTNAATIKGWPKAVTVVDIMWGTVLTALVCGISTIILS